MMTHQQIFAHLSASFHEQKPNDEENCITPHAKGQ